MTDELNDAPVARPVQDDVLRKVHYDPSERKFSFVNVQDVEPILDFNAALRGQVATHDWGRPVANIPMTLILQWVYEEEARGNHIKLWSDDCDRLIERKINDPDFKRLLLGR